MIDNEGNRTLPAAAIPEWAVVRIPGRDSTFVIYKIINACPQPGDITWVDEGGMEEVVGGSQKIEVVVLPTNDNPHPSPGVIE